MVSAWTTFGFQPSLRYKRYKVHPWVGKKYNVHLWVRLRQELQDVGKADDGLLTLKYLLMKSDWHLKHMLLLEYQKKHVRSI